MLNYFSKKGGDRREQKKVKNIFRKYYEDMHEDFQAGDKIPNKTMTMLSKLSMNEHFDEKTIHLEESRVLREYYNNVAAAMRQRK